MLMNLTLPPINTLSTFAIVNNIHASVGENMQLRKTLMDVAIDLSAVVQHDCPPVSHFRIVVRDHVYLRRLDVIRGDRPSVGANLAIFSTEPDEPLDGAVARQVRVAMAGIIPQEFWSGI